MSFGGIGGFTSEVSAGALARRRQSCLLLLDHHKCRGNQQQVGNTVPINSYHQVASSCNVCFLLKTICVIVQGRPLDGGKVFVESRYIFLQTVFPPQDARGRKGCTFNLLPD